MPFSTDSQLIRDFSLDGDDDSSLICNHSRTSEPYQSITSNSSRVKNTSKKRKLNEIYDNDV